MATSNPYATIKGKPKANVKAQKMMIGSIADQMRQIFDMQQHTLKKMEFSYFWTRIFSYNGLEATRFLVHQLFKGLDMWLKTREFNPADSKAPEKPSTGAVPVETLISTVTFIVLNFPLDVKSKELVDTVSNMQRLDSFREMCRKFPSLKDAFRFLALRIESAEIVGPLVIGCSTLHSIEEFVKFSNFVFSPTVDDTDVKAADGAFLFAFLKQMATEGLTGYYPYVKKKAEPGDSTPGTGPVSVSPLMAPASPAIAPSTPVLRPEMKTTTILMNKRALILQHLVDKCLTLPQQLKMNPAVAETTLLALCFMIRHFLVVAPVLDRVFLKRAVATLSQFYLWPKPFGTYVMETLQMIQAEMVSPGTSLRLKLSSEFSCATFSDPSFAGERVPAAFYIYSSECERSTSLSRLLELAPFPKEDWIKDKRKPFMVRDANPLSPTNQALFLFNMLKNEIEMTEDDLKAFSALTPEAVESLLDRSLDIVREASENPDQTHDIRLRGFMSLKSELHSLAAASAGKAPVKLPDTLTVPLLPPLCHVALPTELSRYNPDSIADITMAAKLMGLKEDEIYISNPLVNHLSRLLKHYTGPEKRPVVLRLVVAGGDRLLHQVLCALMHIRQAEKELLDGIQLQWYIVPWAVNHVSAFLARHDSWYNRHVYSPFRQDPLLVPWCRSSSTDEDDEEEMCAPAKAMRSLMDSYIRHSNGHFNVRIYRCEAWHGSSALKGGVEVKDGGAPPDLCIPFIQRVEMSEVASARMYKERRNLSTVRLDDILKDKSFKPSEPEVTVKFITLDLENQLSPECEEEAAIYAGLIVSNVPRKGDRTFPSDPQNSCLEMLARIKARTQRPQQRGVGENRLAVEPRQHVIAVEITCVDPREEFEILVDDQVFGPFRRIRIGPVLKESAKASNPAPWYRWPQMPADSIASMSFNSFFPTHY